MPQYDAETLARGRWWNPVFLVIFVPGALAWLAVVGWLTWRFFNPIADWLGGQHAAIQEVVGTLLFLAWAVGLVWGLAGASMLAERVARIPPDGAAATGQTAGKHAGWTPPKRS